MKDWISFPRVAGSTSRQAHCDPPEGTYEREAGREGFFGPATHFHHKHPPTGWVKWEGPLRPRAFDLNKIGGSASPWGAQGILGNAATAIRLIAGLSRAAEPASTAIAIAACKTMSGSTTGERDPRNSSAARVVSDKTPNAVERR